MSRRTVIIAFIWFVFGYLAYLSSIYLFSFGVTPFFKSLFVPVFEMVSSKYVKVSVLFLFFYIAQFIMVFLFSVVLSAVSGVKPVWLFMFLVANLMLPVFEETRVLISYFQDDKEFPAWATTQLTNFIIGFLMITPLLLWLGSRVGLRFYKRNHKTK